MSEVWFYHLTRKRQDQVLPELLDKALAAGRRSLVLAGSAERVAALDGLLWSAGANESWLPHGTAADSFAAEQPILLAAESGANPNAADLLVLIDGADPLAGQPAWAASFARIVDLFDGHDGDAVAAARARWRRAKAAGHQLAYWQQSPEGGWVKKAEA